MSSRFRRLEQLNPDQIIIPSLSLPDRGRFQYWRGQNLGSAVLGYTMSGGGAIAPPMFGPVHVSRLESIARQTASAESNARRLTYQVGEEALRALRQMGYEGDGNFPGIVIGINPNCPINPSLNPACRDDYTEGTLFSIPMADIDPASQAYMHELMSGSET